MNEDLRGAEHIGKGVIISPECFDFGRDGKGYVSLGGGHVAALSPEGELLEYLFHVGGFVADPASKDGLKDRAFIEYCVAGAKKNPIDEAAENKCGRPLGIRYRVEDGEEVLYILDTVFGLFKFNLASRSGAMLFPASEPVRVPVPRADEACRAPPKFLNDLDITRDGVVYLTDSSYKFPRTHNRMEILEAGPRGRVFRWDHTSGLTVIACGLHFPNGVQLSEDDKTLYVAESTRFRIRALDLERLSSDESALAEGLRSCGESDDFAPGTMPLIEALPGLPDNIRRDARGGIMIGFGTPNARPFSLLHFTYQPRFSFLRSLIAKFVPMHLVEKLVPYYGLAGRVTTDGRIEHVHHDASGRTPLISHAAVNPVTGKLWLGSITNDYLAIAAI